jgi:hypothetical protein
MTNNIDKNVVKNIRTLYKDNDSAKKMFDLLASRNRDIGATSIDWVMREIELWRADAVKLLRELDAAGCGTFYQGRRGAKTRIEWEFSCISIGQAAAGEANELESVEDAITEDDEKASLSFSANTEPMTIAKAKSLLAESLGVQSSSIEITIKA